MENRTATIDGESRRKSVVGEPVYNEKGIIAESYRELQGLASLENARYEYPVQKASDQSTLRAVFQAAEVALLNLSDIMSRAKTNLDEEAFSKAAVKMFWARAFNRLLTRISVIPQQLAAVASSNHDKGSLKIQESPAFREYFEKLVSFDRKVMRLLECNALNAEVAIGDGSLDQWEFNLLHLIRVCSHESTIWEHNLAEVRLPDPVPAYSNFVAAQTIREAVYERVLSGDTYFTQFRGLHQIPEILGEEVNDHLEEVIRQLRAGRLQMVVEHLQCVDILMQVVVASVSPMADNLSTSDYHLIRENLGLTSGSHSICLRFHMFTHLYEDLYEALSNYALKVQPNPENNPVTSLRAIAESKNNILESWLIHLIGQYCLKFRASVSEWRDEHLNMPRNNLGGHSTKSLTGSPDAVKAVRAMRDGSRAKDPFIELAESRNFPGEPKDGQLLQYFDSPDSLDFRILEITGKITQTRFIQVQERLGFFANRCPFSAPPRRKA